MPVIDRIASSPEFPHRGWLVFLIMGGALLGSCGTAKTTTHPQAVEVALEQVTIDGQALIVDVANGGERQALLNGTPFADALAAHQLEPDRIKVVTAVGHRISVVALSAPDFPAASWAESYIAALVTSAGRRFTEVGQRPLGGKQVTTLTVATTGCTEPCVDEVVVYVAGTTVFVVQTDNLDRADALIAELP
jgi:hypothetical protein